MSALVAQPRVPAVGRICKTVALETAELLVHADSAETAPHRSGGTRKSSARFYRTNSLVNLSQEVGSSRKAIARKLH